MRRLLLLALAATALAAAAEAPSHWLLALQLAPDIDLTHLTPQQAAVFTEHGKHLGTLYARGLVAGGRTQETVGTLAIVILACDEATARAALADDPAVRAGYLKGATHLFSLLMPPSPPAVLVSDTRANYDAVAGDLMDAARAMPDGDYGFRPAPGLPSFGQLVGRAAEAQYMVCSLTLGEPYQPRHIEQTLSKKSDLVPALESAVGFCRESWSKLAPRALADPVTLFGRERTRLGAMDSNTGEAFEQYGNMIMYLQVKGVRPSGSR